MTRPKVDIDDKPRSLRSEEAVFDRKSLLNSPHIAPLTQYVSGLRAKYPQDWEFQDFDPLDGGIGADMLFLLEKPGPMTSPTGQRKGSGFISRNNDDPTAEAVFDFMNKANIPRNRVVLWNVIPGWNKEIRVTAAEWNNGINELEQLLSLLPNLSIVVLVGKKAARAKKVLSKTTLQVFRSAHPSPKVRATNKELWDLIPHQWADAASR